MLEEIKALVEELNNYCDAYYGRNESLISDYEYDEKFDRLLKLERESGTVLPNSPTHRVGTEVVSALKKVEHNHPMLSLDKTKDVNEISKFIGSNKALAMLKLDGLTISLKYNNGILVSAETRGNGTVGEDVLHTVRTFTNVPLKINYEKELICDGEAIIDYDTFNRINESVPEEERYKNPRNLAAGSVRQLDSSVAAKRRLKFILWKCIKGYEGNSFMESLDFCSSLGFDVVPYVEVTDVEKAIEMLKSHTEFPIDGIVFSYDDIAYGKSLGYTGHHVRSQMAFKFYDEEVESVLTDVIWSMGRTGELTPVAVFESVELEGTIVQRASLHNLSMYKDLKLGIGDTIMVYKANQIIPQISENCTQSDTLSIPVVCPICGEKLAVIKDNSTEVLMCVNSSCEGKLINKLCNFVSKNGMDIKGFSKKTIEKLMSVGLLNSFLDVYNLPNETKKLLSLEGFGTKKVTNLIQEIEKSKEVTLDKFLVSLGIKGLGTSNAKRISDIFNGDFWKLSLEIEAGFNFTVIEDIGEVLNSSIHNYWKIHYEEIYNLARIMEWKIAATEQRMSNITVAITGKLENYSRRELKDFITSAGGKVSDSVGMKTTLLINNDPESESSKNRKAKSLGIPILTENEFVEKYLK